MKNNFDAVMEEMADFANAGGMLLWQNFATQAQQTYEKISDAFDNEIQIPLSESQVNQMLDRFVVKNVNAILDLHLDIHDGWFRLYATINTSGIYAEVAANFSLIHVQLDRHVQRFVFGQLTHTDILALHAQSYPKKLGINLAVWAFHKVLKKDPLGFILDYINIARPKDNILYLDIGRWLKKNEKIMGYLHKAQVNHGFLAEEQLVLKGNINLADVLNFAGNSVLISEEDNPDKITKDKLQAEIDDREKVTEQTEQLVEAGLDKNLAEKISTEQVEAEKVDTD